MAGFEVFTEALLVAAIACSGDVATRLGTAILSNRNGSAVAEWL
jgi:hypothetical protein